MRGIIAKFFRREARNERGNESGVNDRDLINVDNSGSKVNTPHSIRKLYLFLKGQYKKLRADVSTTSWANAQKHGLVAHHKTRGHGKKKESRPQLEDRLIMIERPLQLILHHCPTKLKPGGAPEFHPVYASARRAADAGRGDLVKKMAAQFVPA